MMSRASGVLCTLTVLSLMLSAECVLIHGTPKPTVVASNILDDDISFYTLAFDYATESFYHEYLQYRTRLTCGGQCDENDSVCTNADACTRADNAPYIVYDGLSLFVKAGTSPSFDTLNVSKLPDFNPSDITELKMTGLLHKTMNLHGDAGNRLVLFYADSVIFVRVDGTNKPTVNTSSLDPPLSGSKIFTDVYNGVIVKDEDTGAYHFIDISDEKHVKVESLSGKIDLSSDVFTRDKRGYYYVANGAEITREDISGKTSKKSVLAQSSSDVVAVHYDEVFDVIYAVGKTSVSGSFNFYMVPAGEGFDFSKIEKESVPESLYLYLDVYHTNSKVAVATYERDGEAGHGTYVFFTTEKCASSNQTQCYSDLQHCRFSLKENKCKTLPNCQESDICVDDTPFITDMIPESGSTKGNTTVMLTFNIALPKKDLIQGQIKVKVGTGSSAQDIVATVVDSKTISFETPNMTAAGPVSVTAHIGNIQLGTKTFSYYECGISTGGSCFTCLADKEARPECVWNTRNDKCITADPNDDQLTQVSSDSLCPVIEDVSNTTVTADSEFTVTLNVLLSARTYYCIFHNDTGEWSVQSSVIFGRRVNCTIPKDLTGGFYDLWLSPFSDSQKTYYTKDGAAVKMHLVDCGDYKSCSSCTGIDGCSWCFEDTFKCVKSDSCRGSVKYESQCPYIANKLYVDIETLESNKYKAEVHLKDADLPESYNSLIVCSESDGITTNDTETKCKYNDKNDIVCTCELSVEPGVEKTSLVSLKLNDGLLTESQFFVVNCTIDELGGCFDNAFRGCVWDLEKDKCIVLPTDHRKVTWVSNYSTVVSYPEFIDAFKQDIKVEFNSFVNSSSLSFKCNLISNESVIETAALIPDTDTVAYCNFGNLAKSLELETNQSITGLRININVSSSGTRADDSRIQSIFEYLNNGPVKESSLINCGASDEKLSCYDCRSLQNSACLWSRSKAMCTAAPDDTRVQGECPSLHSLSPNKVIFEKGDNITFIGESLIPGLKIRFTDVDNSKNVVEGSFIFINDTTMNFTVEKVFEPAQYNVTVFVSSGRLFVASNLTLEVPENPISIILLVEILVPVLVVVIALIIIAIILAKKRVFRPFKFDVNKKPNFLPFSYATDIWNASRSGEAFPADEGARDEFRALLQDPQVCAALCKSTSSTEADSFSGAMIYVYATNGHCLDLLMSLVDQEVESVPNSTQLFRGNSLASKAFRAYSRMVGLNYLWMTLSRFVHELNHLTKGKSDKKDDNEHQDADGESGPSILSTEFEVDPTKLASGADEESQSYLLSQRARQLVLCITRSTQYLPPELRLFAAKLKTRVTQRFPEAEHIAIGGMFFLRFICPAIIAPHSYALLMTEDRKRPVVPNDQLQRQLILLGKVLQNLANGVLFGKKEPFMISMNDFITNNLPTINEWMDSIGSNSSASESPTSVPAKTLNDSYSFLAAHVRTNMNKIRAALTSQGAPADLAQRLEYAVGN